MANTKKKLKEQRRKNERKTYTEKLVEKDCIIMITCKDPQMRVRKFKKSEKKDRRR